MEATLYELGKRPGTELDLCKVFARSVLEYSSLRGDPGKGRTMAAAEAFIAASCYWRERTVTGFGSAEVEPLQADVPPARRITAKTVSSAFWAANLREVSQDFWPPGFRENLRVAMAQARDYFLSGIVLENWRQTEEPPKFWEILGGQYNQMIKDANTRSWFETRDVRFANFCKQASRQQVKVRAKHMKMRLHLARPIVMARVMGFLSPGEIGSAPVDTIKALAIHVKSSLESFEPTKGTAAARRVYLKELEDGLGISG